MDELISRRALLEAMKQSIAYRMVHDRDVDYVDYCSRAERREVDYND